MRFDKSRRVNQAYNASAQLYERHLALNLSRETAERQIQDLFVATATDPAQKYALAKVHRDLRLHSIAAQEGASI
jgi:hypothetical protein